MAVLGHQQARVPRVQVVPAGGPLIGQEYARIKDQNNVIWYWWISYDLSHVWDDEPEFSFDKEVKRHLIPSWFKLVDSDSQVWFLHPELDGSPTLSIIQPSVGEGLVASPKLRVRGGRVRYQYTVVGGDVDVASV